MRELSLLFRDLIISKELWPPRLLWFITARFICIGILWRQCLLQRPKSFGWTEDQHIVTCRPVAKKRVDKHVCVEIDSWKPTRYGTHFRGYEWSTEISMDTHTLYRGGSDQNEVRVRTEERIRWGRRAIRLKYPVPGGITGPPCSWGI
jgi:hypothetical protein